LAGEDLQHPLALVFGEKRGKPLDHLAHVGRVEGRQDQMSRLGSLKGDRRGFLVADLPDEDDIRGLSEGAPQSLREIGRVEPDSPLGENGLLPREDELDRILDRHHMTFQAAVHPVQQRGERRGFARSSRPGHDQQAGASLDRGPQQFRRHAERVEIGGGCGDPAQDRAFLTETAVKIHPETHTVPREETGVMVAGLPRHPAGFSEGDEIGPAQGRSLQRSDASRNPHHRRLPRLKNEIGGLVFHGGPAVELDGIRSWGHKIKLSQLPPAVQSAPPMVRSGIATGNRTPIMRMRTACPNR
jgi:hypothetical protein